MSLVNLSHLCSHLQNASVARLGLTSVPHSRLHLAISLVLQKQGFFSQVKLGGASPPLSCFPPGTQNSPTRLPIRGRDRESALARLVGHREDFEERQRRIQVVTSEKDLAGEMATYANSLVSGHGFDRGDVDWALSYSHKSTQELLEDGVEVEAMGLTVENQPLAASSETIDTEDEGIVTQENRASRRLWLGLKYWNGEPVLRKARMISKPTKRIWLSNRDYGRLIRGKNAGEVKGFSQIGEVMVVSTDRGVMDARECAERDIGGQALARFW